MRYYNLLALPIAAALMLGLGYYLGKTNSAVSSKSNQTRPTTAVEEALPKPPPSLTTAEAIPQFSYKKENVAAGSSSYQVLRQLGFTPGQITDIVRAAKPLFRLNKVSPGTLINLKSDIKTKAPVELSFTISPIKTLSLQRTPNKLWTAEWIEKTRQRDVWLCSTDERIVPLTRYGYICAPDSASKKIKDILQY